MLIETAPHNPSDDIIKRIFGQVRTIAVVGLSPKPERDSYKVSAYMQKAGYRIIPVNPGQKEILGEKCYPLLESITEKVQLVNVFRRSEHVPEITDSARLIGAETLWLQLGIRHDEAANRVKVQGMVVVQDSCIMVEHKRLSGPE